jgi:secreted PhoX family phosphatase
MKKLYTSAFAVLGFATAANCQSFPIEIDVTSWDTNDWKPETVVVPQSPIKSQVLFIGGTDMVQTVDQTGAPNGATLAKQWHDFIGFTTDENSSDLGWVSVNHEMIQANDDIGDGGGMTVFKIRRNATNDSIEIVDQTLADNRSGKFFNVDFVNTVGETGMNCGGIQSTVDGRIWTAEEWFRSSNASLATDFTTGGAGVRDTADWTISTDIDGDFDGSVVSKYENFNYMVEIDPREAVAVRKQYNWGRQGFEGGVVMPDNKTVYLGVDATPAAWVKFVADNAGDFTSGSLYYYKHDNAAKWIEIDNSQLSNMLNLNDITFPGGATMYNRIEWVAYSQATGKIYFTETGRDNPGSRWRGEKEDGGVHAPHHIARATAQGTAPDSSDYVDYYGRVMEFDPATDQMRVFLSGGPEFHNTPDVTIDNYPSKHLSNPDGLSFFRSDIGGTPVEFMIVNEDLNGSSHGRVPMGTDNRTCELFLLDMNIENPTVDNLIRIAAVPAGAEVTGAVGIDDNTILFNSQHPSSDNPFPYNNSLTVALTGWKQALAEGSLFPTSVEEVANSDAFRVYPNPASREIQFNTTTDVAIYDATGARVKVARNVKYLQIEDLSSGVYFLQNAEGETTKLIIE